MNGSRDLQAALAALPHGPEFRFVDELAALDPGRAGHGRYRVRGDEAFLAGHFPGDPLVPGVVLVEAIAQLGGVVAQADPERPPPAQLRLGAIRQAKILGAARPGDQLEIHARIDGRMGGMVQVSGSVRCREAELATAVVVLAGEPAPDAAAR